ncbi:tRNA-splicing endonuclease subunit sen54 [Sporothrix eucalyptigena]|uniref:tRNA-splicing endonuclease subunit sen54 n=1 Tax=Sporothrix eucalyptigena TaxID=1812306 RepID=A0ABP0C4H6_9PEZI
MPPAQMRNDAGKPLVSAKKGSILISGGSNDIAAHDEEDLLPGDDEEAGLVPNGRNDNDRYSADRAALGDDDNDDDNDDGAPEVQDYSGFAALIGAGDSKKASSSSSGTLVSAPSRKKQISSQSIRKGEKDFEEHGTRAQRDALEQSRAVMESVLSYTRVHSNGPSAGANGSSSGGNDVIRGWYFPDIWQDEKEEDEEESEQPADTNENTQKNHARRFAHTRHRVVMVETKRGPMFASMGAVPGRPKWIEGVLKEEQPKPQLGFDRTWLLPEEALFMLERGSMELYWPLQDLEAILSTCEGETKQAASNIDIDDDERGIPLSLQAAYALLIGPDKDTPRGRISLPSYQVYTNLRRAGYMVLRAVKVDTGTPLDAPTSPQPQTPSPPTSIWQWLFSLLSRQSSPPSSDHNGIDPSSPPPPHPPCGPLVQPGFYRSYGPIYSQLRLVSPYLHTKPPPVANEEAPSSDSPFQIVFHVWKAGASPATAGTGTSTSFPKTRPPPPDFYMAVADANATGVPSLEQVTELLASVPPLPESAHLSKKSKQAAAAQAAKKPASASSAPSFPPLPVIYRRLKLGRRCVIIAVVDHGIINYMRFSDGTYSASPLWPRFDQLAAGRFSAGVNGGARKNKGKSGGGKNQRKKNSGVKTGSGKGATATPAITTPKAVSAPASAPGEPKSEEPKVNGSAKNRPNAPSSAISQ